jgi:hypothetical protein
MQFVFSNRRGFVFDQQAILEYKNDDEINEKRQRMRIRNQVKELKFYLRDEKMRCRLEDFGCHRDSAFLFRNWIVFSRICGIEIKFNSLFQCFGCRVGFLIPGWMQFACVLLLTPVFLFFVFAFLVRYVVPGRVKNLMEQAMTALSEMTRSLEHSSKLDKSQASSLSI